MRVWGVAAATLLWGCVSDVPITDGGTDAGCTIPSGGKTILCGNLSCSGIADNNSCCMFDGGSTSCNCAGGDAGPIPAGILFRWSCDKGSDCSLARSCCLASYVSLSGPSCPLPFSSTAGKTDCMDACASGLRLCANDDDCKSLSGKTCKAIQLSGIPKIVGACL